MVYFSLGECVSECFNFGVEQKHMPHHQRFIWTPEASWQETEHWRSQSTSCLKHVTQMQFYISTLSRMDRNKSTGFEKTWNYGQCTDCGFGESVRASNRCTERASGSPRRSPVSSARCTWTPPAAACSAPWGERCPAHKHSNTVIMKTCLMQKCFRYCLEWRFSTAWYGTVQFGTVHFWGVFHWVLYLVLF